MDVDVIDSERLSVAVQTRSCEKPQFSALSAGEAKSGLKFEINRIPVPAHRYTPLKKNWSKLYEPLVTHLKLQVRMNLRKKCVEVRNSAYTKDIGHLQRATDFINAFMMGFDVNDAVAMLRLDDLYIDTFDICDVKTLRGDHLSRTIGRIAGKDGRTKYAIENSTRTRIVLADSTIHILGSFQNIRIAKDAICDLILGSPPGKVYGNLKIAASRMHSHF